MSCHLHEEAHSRGDSEHCCTHKTGLGLVLKVSGVFLLPARSPLKNQPDNAPAYVLKMLLTLSRVTPGCKVPGTKHSATFPHPLSSQQK